MTRALPFALLLAAACSPAEREEARPAAGPAAFGNIVFLPEARWPTPDSFATGRFVAEGPCLLFVTEAGVRYDPVLPFGAAPARDEAGALTVALGGRAVREGETVTVKGGSGEYGRRDARAARCADEQFIVGGLSGEDA